MKARKQSNAKALLRKLSNDLYGEIYQMTSRQRRAALVALDNLSERDSWTLFALRHALREFVVAASGPGTKAYRERMQEYQAWKADKR